MPITPAHAAAVVPLRQWKEFFWLSPLVVGSMAPDYLYYFFPPLHLRHFGHTWLGLFVFCIPAGLSGLYAFHAFVKRPLVLLMPRRLRAKLWSYCGAYPFLPLPRLIWIATLIFFGAVTHVAWDGITHENGWAVSGNPSMHAVLFTVLDRGVHLYGLLQYSSSAGGLALLAWWAWQWYLTAPEGEAPDVAMPWGFTGMTLVATMVAFATIVGIISGSIYAARVHDTFPYREFLASAFICTVDAFLLIFAAFCVHVHCRNSVAQSQPEA